MKPCPKLRKTLKWMALVVSVLLLTVWVGSAWFAVSWSIADGGVRTACGCGAFAVSRWKGISGGGGGVKGPNPYFERLGTPRDPFIFWFRVTDNRVFRTDVIPLWVPLLIFGGVTAGIWGRDHIMTKRTSVSACAKCGYDRSYLAPDAVCPECGKAR